MNLGKICLLVVTVSVLGCANKTTTWISEPYKLADNVAFAELTNELVPALGDGETVTITTPLDSCEKQKADRQLQASNARIGTLFLLEKGKTVARQTHRVPAGKPFYIQFAQRGQGPNSAQCYVHVIVNLEEGKKYSLVGGFHLMKGPIPVVTGGSGCALGVMDNETQRLVPSRGQLCPADVR